MEHESNVRFPWATVKRNARNFWSRSDADVAVLLSGGHQRFLTTALAMADVAYDVLLETGINISPLPVWLDEWEHQEAYPNPALLWNIAQEGIRL